MLEAHIDWLLAQTRDLSCFEVVYKSIFTVVFLFVSRWLYQLFFTPLQYYWDDPAMTSLSPTEMAKRQIKLTKKLGTLPPFPNGWFKILLSNELLPGQVKYVQGLGKEWAVFRTKSGKPGLVGAYCPHLGADLSQGTVSEDGGLVCPFHAFEFNTEGQCTKIPGQTNIPKGMKCQDIPHIIERNGAILVWFDVDGKEPQWEVPDIFEGNPEKYKLVAQTHHRIHTHLQEIHENGADVAHLQVVHWRTLLHIPIFWHQWGIKWEPSNEIKHMSNFKVKEAVKIGNTVIPGTVYDVTGHHVGPGFVHFKIETPFGDVVICHQILPLEGFLQDSCYQMWAAKSVPTFFAKILMRGWVQQLERDIVIWNQKIYLPAPQIVSIDGPIPQYRRWFKQFYSEKGTKKKFDLTDKDLF